VVQEEQERRAQRRNDEEDKTPAQADGRLTEAWC